MYPAGTTGAQAAPQAQAGPAASSAYSSYQPTAAPGYQVPGREGTAALCPASPAPLTPPPSAERGAPGPPEPAHLAASRAAGHHGLHGEPVRVPVPALQHAGERGRCRRDPRAPVGGGGVRPATPPEGPRLTPQNLMSTLPAQDASLAPQQPYLAGQQPPYQQVSRPQAAAPRGLLGRWEAEGTPPVGTGVVDADARRAAGRRGQLGGQCRIRPPPTAGARRRPPAAAAPRGPAASRTGPARAGRRSPAHLLRLTE